MPVGLTQRYTTLWSNWILHSHHLSYLWKSTRDLDWHRNSIFECQRPESSPKSWTKGNFCSSKKTRTIPSHHYWALLLYADLRIDLPGILALLSRVWLSMDYRNVAIHSYYRRLRSQRPESSSTLRRLSTESLAEGNFPSKCPWSSTLWSSRNQWQSRMDESW